MAQEWSLSCKLAESWTAFYRSSCLVLQGQGEEGEEEVDEQELKRRQEEQVCPKV